jgi:hypothetical protein
MEALGRVHQFPAVNAITTNIMKLHSRNAVRLALALAALVLNLSFTLRSYAATFTATGALSGIRAGHAATLLRNGKVLVEGGFNGTVRLASSELYNPPAGTWSSTGFLNLGRTTHTATLLPNGSVLVAGGHDSASTSTATCEVYDPAAGTWTFTTALASPRGNHTATLLLNGKVLVVSGRSRSGNYEVATAELYDPATGTWTSAGSLANPRDFHTATLLLDGKVLVAGGGPDGQQYTSLSSAELYDPATGLWTTTGSMLSARQAHTATLLPDGRVLVAAGFNQGYFISSAELYDPATGTWAATGPLNSTRGVHTATLLPNGQVLAVGGNHNTLAAPTIVPLSSAELYDPAAGIWTATGSMNAARSTHTATLLPNGQVLIAAGYNTTANVQLSSAELYGSSSGPLILGKGRRAGAAFQFSFIGAAGATNTVLATANPALPSSSWTVLGVAPEFAPGLFFFSDPEAASNPQRFYRVRSP